MIKITDAAATQIKNSITETKIDPMPLRFAVKKAPTGEFQYLMGFDSNSAPMDTSVTVNGIDIVVSFDNKALIDGMTVDYVELEEGDMNFIFQNPNDPNHGNAK